MKAENRWRMTEQEKEQLIDLLTPELPVLRKKAKISQDDLSNLLGVSRQTYGANERRSRRMTWNTYLSIILFYDKNPNTHELIRSLGVYPQEMISRFNPGGEAPYIELSGFLPEGMDAWPFVQEGIARKVACVPGAAFVMDPKVPSNAFRMNFSMPSLDQIDKGTEILGKLTYEWCK